MLFDNMLSNTIPACKGRLSHATVLLPSTVAVLASGIIIMFMMSVGEPFPHAPVLKNLEQYVLK